LARGGAEGLEFDIPLVFYGHSFGALLAFEVAHVLRERGEPLPLALVVSGRRAPQCTDSESPICGLSDADFLEQVSVRYGGIPEEVRRNEELSGLLLPALRADMSLTEGYQYAHRGSLEVPILSFGGLDDIRVTRAELGAWKEETNRDFLLEMIAGGHFFHLDSRDYLLRRMDAWLTSAGNAAYT